MLKVIKSDTMMEQGFMDTHWLQTVADSLMKEWCMLSQAKKMMYDNLILRYMIQENYAKDNINTQQYDWSEEAHDQMLEEGWQETDWWN